MKRFFVKELHGKSYKMTGDDHNHLTNVLRAKVGEEVVLCPQDGCDYIYSILAIGKKETELNFVEKQINKNEPSVNLTLYMSILKGDKMDYVVQKATELGVNTIAPLYTKYVQFLGDVKVDRLNKICVEASKQCGRGKLPVVLNVNNFDEMLAKLPTYDLVVFAYEKAEDVDLKSYLSAKKQEDKNIKNVAIIIGSEGGFSGEEVAAVERAGAIGLTLGKRILRAETASVAVTSIVMYELGEFVIIK